MMMVLIEKKKTNSITSKKITLFSSSKSINYTQKKVGDKKTKQLNLFSIS